MTIWFTSDNHFGHKNIPKYCPWSRGHYNSVEEMDEDMIRIWNSRVKEGDLVFNLGDLTFHRSYDKIAAILKRLNGIKIFIMGNHDELVIEHRERFLNEGLLYSIQDYREQKIDGQKIVMMHFPLAVWNKNHHGSFNLYGHCHGSFKAVGKQMDVGWDTNDLNGTSHTPGPISWEQVKKLLNSRKMISQDHHEESNPN